MKYLALYIILAIIAIAALVYFFWWKPNHPAGSAEGLYCTTNNQPGKITNGICVPVVISDSGINVLPNGFHH
jgi:hypothetical protein